MIYKSKVDIWLGVILLASCFGFTWVVVLLMSVGQVFEVLIALLILALGVALPCWIFIFTQYEITSDMLRIKCGPFHWRIRRNDIQGIEETRNPLSSPALSLDRLRIEYGLGRSIMVSPQNKTQFIKDITS